mgnify:CR=1 FL=1
MVFDRPWHWVPAEAVVPDANKQSVVSVAYLMVNQIKAGVHFKV